MEKHKHHKLHFDIEHKGHHKPVHASKSKLKTALPWAIGAVVLIALIAVVLKYDILKKSPGVVATVDGKEITVEELNKRLEQVPADYKMFATKELILNQTITEIVLLNEAEKQGIVVSDDEVMSIITQSLATSGASLEDLKTFLEAQNLTMEDVLDAYKKQIMIVQLLNQTVVSNIRVEDDEIEKYYNENEIMFQTPEQVTAAHILIKFENRTEEGALSEINSIKSELNSTNFGELAAKYSEDPGSAYNGGEYTFGKGEMVTEFEDAAFSLGVGGVSEPIKTVYGYHLIKLYNKTKAEKMPFEDAKESISQVLIAQKQQEAVTAYVNELVSKADVKIFEIE